MSDAFDVPIEIADVTIVGPLPVPVTGTFTPSGTQDVNIVSSIPLSVTGPLTDAQLRAAAVPVTIPTPVPVTDNGGSLTVDGTVTALQGTSPWVVSGSITTSADVNVHDGAGNTISSTGTSLNVDVTNTIPVTGPLTDAQLRATPVPISGTVTATPTGTQDVRLVATTITQPISAVSLPLPSGASTSALQTQPGVDIGDVTVNNAAGASAVNIQDGGNSITVDGSVTANAGTNLNTSALLLDATFTGRINTQGQKTMAASTPVVLASDQSTLNVNVVFPTGTLNNGIETAVAGTAVSILAANTTRNKLILQNTGVANIRIGTTGITATTGFRLAPGATMIMDNPECPTNEIFAIREGTVSSTVLAQEVV